MHQNTRLTAALAKIATGVCARTLQLLTTLGILLLAAAAIGASALLGQKLSDDWRTFPRLLDAPTVAAVLITAFVAVAGFVAFLRLPRHRLLVGLAIAAIVRVAVVVLVDAPLEADWAEYHKLATRIAAGGDRWSNIPTGYPLALALAYAAFGPSPVIAELLNVGFGVVTAGIAYQLGKRVFGETAGAAALYLVAIMPDQVLMTPVVASEPLYAMLVMIAVAALFEPGVARAVLCGAALAASQYVRTTTMLLLPAVIAVIPHVDRWRLRMTVVALAFAVVIAPVVRHNLIMYREFSISTSRHGAWSLLLGTNDKYSGRFNREDLALIGGIQWSAEGSRIAAAEAVKRITSRPDGFAALVVRKFDGLWSSGDYATWTAVPTAAQATRSAISLFSQAAWSLVLVLATVVAWKARREPFVALVAGVVVMMTLAHSFLEVMARYHSYVVPLLCVLAAPRAADLADRWGRFRPRAEPIEQISSYVA